MLNIKRTVLNVQQGTPEWLAFRAASDGTASEYPAAAGKSKYQTREELLKARHTGLVKAVDANTQKLFDKGHETEALARPIAESVIGEELSPTTVMIEVDGLKLLASLDGITFDDESIFEHKLYSEILASQVANEELGAHYTLQMDQELLVSGASKCLFMVSDGTTENNVWCWYETTDEKKQAVIDTWKQFHKDLADYVPVEIKEKPKAEVIEALPVPSIQAKGELVVSNLAEMTPLFDRYLAETKTELVTDQDFSDGEANAKNSREAAKNLKLTAKAVIDQIETVSEAVRTLELYAEKFDALGLKLEKAVKEQKEAIKAKAISDARLLYVEHRNGLQAEINPILLTLPTPDFATAIKGIRTIESLHDRINTTLANAKIELDAAAKDIRAKLAWVKANADGYGFLFADLQQIIGKPMDDFQLLVKSRIDEHKRIEAEKKAREEADAKAKEQAALEASAVAVEVVNSSNQQAAQQTPQSSGAPAPNLHAVVVDHQDEIGAFMRSRDFGKDANKIRAAIVEFVKFSAERGMKKAA